MTTIEKLFVQIFERKNSIIEQVKQQTELYNQHLASKCLIEGITPPSWLWNPSVSSDPKELKKEDLISELLLPRPRPAVSYASGYCSLYDKPVVTGDNGADGSLMEAHTSNKDHDARHGLTTMLECHDNDVGCSLNCVPELDFGVNSPQDQADVRISNIYSVPDQSLARIQRSKLRQKALELRNSAKTASKSLSHKNNTGVSSSGISLSTCGNGGIPKPVNSSSIARGEVAHSRSGAKEKPPLANSLNRFDIHALQNTSGGQVISHCPVTHDIINQEGNAETVVVSELVSNRLVEAPPFCSGSKLEGIDSRAPSNCCLFVKPKQLDFDDMGEYNLDKIFSPNSDKERQDKSSEKRFSTLSKPATSLDKDTFDNSSKKLLEKPPVEGGEASKAEEARMHSFEANVECSDGTIRKFEFNVNENCMSKNIKDNSEDVLQIQNSPVPEADVALSNVGTSSQVDMHQVKCNVAKGCEVLSKAEEAIRHSFEANIEYFDDKIRKFGFNLNENFMSKNIKGNSEDVLQIENSPVIEADVARSIVENSPVIEADVARSIIENSPVIEADVARSIGGYSYDVDMHQVKCNLTECCESSQGLRGEEGEHGYEWSDRSLHTLCTFEHKHLGTSLVSSMTEQATGDSHVCLVKEVVVDPASGVLDARRQSGVQDNQNVLHHDDKLDCGNTGKLSYIEKPLKEGNSLLKDGLVTTFSVGPPHGEEENLSCLKLKEIQLAEKFSLTERTFRSGPIDSWPRFKRRRVEDQPISCFSVSPSFRMQRFHNSQRDSISCSLKSIEDNSDAALKFQDFPVSHEDVTGSTVNESPDLRLYEKMKCHFSEGTESSPKLKTKESELDNGERSKSSETLCTLKGKDLGPSRVSSLTKQADANAQGCLVDEVGTEDPTSSVIDVTNQSNEKGSQPMLDLENKVNLLDTSNLSCMESQRERKSHLRQDSLLSHCSVGSPYNYLDLAGVDAAMPIFEGFSVDTEIENGESNIAGAGINFDKLDLPSNMMERASILEQICNSVSMPTPLSHFSSTFKLQRTQEFYQSVPNRLLERMELRSTLSLNDDVAKTLRASYSHVDEIYCVSQGMQYSDCLSYSSARLGLNSTKPYASPVGKLWKEISSNSSSSGKRSSSNPELTCFPIEEDPSISEENEDADEVVDKSREGIGSISMDTSAKRKPLVDLTEACSNPPPSVSAAHTFPDRGSLDSINTELSFSGTRNNVKQKLRNRISNNRDHRNAAKENQTASMGENGFKKPNESIHNRFSKTKLSGKTGLRKEAHRLSEKEMKHNNIVSNINSFIPLVQQKQAAAVCTGKRDIKVKALEAAEASKRLEEKKINERMMKKEALKLERARVEQENLKQMELTKKKKEEQKKKDAEIMAARKRLREEEERNVKERKRKRIEDSQRQQREEEKLRTRKVEKEKQSGMDEKVNMVKESKGKSGKHQTTDRGVDGNILKKTGFEQSTAGILANDVRKDDSDLQGCGDNLKNKSILEKPAENDDLVTNMSLEKSYEISPFRCSDDEEEEEDNFPSKKYIPSWASKHSVALLLSSQQKIDPEVILPRESFCSMDEVLLPRRLKLK